MAHSFITNRDRLLSDIDCFGLVKGHQRKFIAFQRLCPGNKAFDFTLPRLFRRYIITDLDQFTGFQASEITKSTSYADVLK